MKQAVAIAAVLLAACGDGYGDNILSGPRPMHEYVAAFIEMERDWAIECDGDPDDLGWGPGLCRDQGFGEEWNLDCEEVVDIDIRQCRDDMRALPCGPFPVGMPDSCQCLFVVPWRGLTCGGSWATAGHR